MNIAAEFLHSAIKRFREYKELGDKTLSQLADADLVFQPNKASNSIAVIIKHLHGNMQSRWTNFLTEDGEKPWRQRDAEFEEDKPTKAIVLAWWEEGWATLFMALHQLKEDDLLKTITIRSKPLTVVDAINRQLAHYSYHVGQIVYLGRWRKDENWQPLSIPKGGSDAYNRDLQKP